MVLKVVFYFLKQLTSSHRVFIVLNAFLLNILKKSVRVIEFVRNWLDEFTCQCESLESSVWNASNKSIPQWTSFSLLLFKNHFGLKYTKIILFHFLLE